MASIENQTESMTLEQKYTGALTVAYYLARTLHGLRTRGVSDRVILDSMLSNEEKLEQVAELVEELARFGGSLRNGVTLAAGPYKEITDSVIYPESFTERTQS